MGYLPGKSGGIELGLLLPAFCAKREETIALSEMCGGLKYLSVCLSLAFSGGRPGDWGGGGLG